MQAPLQTFLGSLWFALAFGPLAAQATTLTNALVVHLTFDGSLRDSTANHVDGSAPGTGTPDFEDGILGQAAHLVTTTDSTTNNYITLGYPDVLQFGSDGTGDTSDFSVSFWAKIGAQSGDQPFISNKDWNSGDDQGWIIASESDGFKWNLTDDGGTAAHDSPDLAPALLDGNWHNLVVAFSRSTAAISFFDGKPLATNSIAPAPGNPIGSVDTAIYGLSVNLGQDGTGGYNGGGTAALDLLMDDLGIWRRALNASEAEEIYYKGLSGKTLTDEPPVGVSILVQPSGISTFTGLAATFSVSAAGLGLTYQWTLNGTNIPGATAATYAISSVTLADGGMYVCRVLGLDGSATSQSATLAVMNPPEVDLSNGLSIYLPFDGNYQDSTTNHTDGAAVNSPTFASGLFGEAVHLATSADGATNNTISLGYPKAAQVGTNDFTVAFWVKYSFSLGNPPFVANKDWSSGSNPGWIIYSEGGGKPAFNLRDAVSSEGVQSAQHDAEATISAQDGQWHHVAVVFVRSGSGAIYIDGLPVTSASIAPDAGKPVGSLDTEPSNPQLQVFLGNDGTGQYTGAGTAAIDFLMDDFALWKRALAASEVALIVSHGKQGRSLALIPSPLRLLGPSLYVVNRKIAGLTVPWAGGSPPYIVQTAPTPAGPWTSMQTNSTTTASVLFSGPAQFIRIVDSNPGP